MGGSPGGEDTADEGVVRTIHNVVAAYNAHDLDAFRSFAAPDFAGVDHRPGSLGRFDTEAFIAFTEGLFAQVRTQELVLTSMETRGNVALFHLLETAETLDGVEVSFETLMIFAVVGGKIRSHDVFAPEAEAEARAFFEELAKRFADEVPS